MNTEHERKEIYLTALTPMIDELIQSGTSVEIIGTGSSMVPMLIHRKSAVRLAAPGTLRIGDIPLYRRRSGQFVIHRIVGIKDGSYICCGDRQWNLEYGIGADQIIAVVTDFKRTERWISCQNWLYRIYWHIWIAVLPIRRYIFGGYRRTNNGRDRRRVSLRHGDGAHRAGHRRNAVGDHQNQ